MPEKSTSGRAEHIFPPMMPFGFEAFMDMQRPALEAVAQMNERVYDNIATMNRNWVAFVNRRLKEDMAVPQQLAECKSVHDMYGVCTEFFQTAMADYQAEFEKMAKLGKSMAEDTAQAVQSGAEDVVKSTAEKVRSRAA